MKKIHRLKTILCGLALLSTGMLHADIVTYDYFGTVTSLQGPAEPNFGGVVVGNTVSGSFSFDTNAINKGNAQFGAYDMTNLSLQTGALLHTVLAPELQIDLGNEYMWEAGGQGKNPDYALVLELGDTTAPYIQTDTLLRPPPDVANVDIHRGYLNFFHSPENQSTFLNFNLDRIVQRTPSVPDSGGTLALLALSFGLLMFYRHRLHRTLIV